MTSTPIHLGCPPLQTAWPGAGEVGPGAVWEIKYDPDIEAEQSHADRQVTAVVVGVDKDGNVDYAILARSHGGSSVWQTRMPCPMAVNGDWRAT